MPSNGTQTSNLFCLTLLDKPKNLTELPSKHTTFMAPLTAQLPRFLTPGITDPLSGKNKKDHIKKPLNAFMLYMKEMRPVVQAECTLKESAAINQILGRRVNTQLSEFKQKFIIISFKLIWRKVLFASKLAAILDFAKKHKTHFLFPKQCLLLPALLGHLLSSINVLTLNILKEIIAYS